MNRIGFLLSGFCIAVLGSTLYSLDLSSVDRWAFWLANIDPVEVASSPFDMVVIDYSADGSGQKAFSTQQVERMQRKPDGGRRIVIAYLSIGEAEEYRYYWKPWWKLIRPSWLERENPNWKGNYKVRFWQKGWQQIIFGSSNAYLDRIVAAGFDGVLLDVVDAFEHFGPSRPEAGDDMIDFVTAISDYAKSRRPGFLVIPQNGEQLTAEPRYVAVIDAIEKEDLFYGLQGDGMRNSREETTFSRDLLDRVKQAGKPVFTVDYASDALTVASAYRLSRGFGYKPYVASRPLDSLNFEVFRQ
ncbi:MAG TPA: MJ1477/TM1410 family putative glycoside hydrolase [Spirochaetia bacterium]|nr:MJ1477/TM1410 family putative glycoside hydrolase [Spirochaetia bacterium]